MTQTSTTDISVIPCRVCNANSSGFHFGAITCEGCKGFFRRSIIEREKRAYVCNRNGSCIINPANRNSCKACRYQRCLAAGMSKTRSRIGRQPNAVKFVCAQEIERLQRGCEEESSGMETGNLPQQQELSTNFVGQKEEQTWKGGSNLSYMVPTPSTPNMMKTTAEKSQSSTLNLLLPGGTPPGAFTSYGLPSQQSGTVMLMMSPVSSGHSYYSTQTRARHDSTTSSGDCSGSIYYPASNTEYKPASPSTMSIAVPQQQQQHYQPIGTHHVVLMSSPAQDSSWYSSNSQLTGLLVEESEQQQQLLVATGAPGEDPTFPQKGSSHQTTVKLAMKYSKSPEELSYFIHRVTVAAYNLRYFSDRTSESWELRASSAPFSSTEEEEGQLWQNMMRHFQAHARSITDFAKGVPGFHSFVLKDKKIVVKESMYPIILLRLSLDYDEGTREFNYFDFTTERRELILRMFPSFQRIADHLQHSGRLLRRHFLNEEEMALLCAVALFNCDNPNICNPDSVRLCHDDTVEALRFYENENPGRRDYSEIRVLPKRATDLLDALQNLFHMNQEHHSIVSTLKVQRPHLNFPYLYVEMFQLREEASSQHQQHPNQHNTTGPPPPPPPRH